MDNNYQSGMRKNLSPPTRVRILKQVGSRGRGRGAGFYKRTYNRRNKEGIQAFKTGGQRF